MLARLLTTALFLATVPSCCCVPIPVGQSGTTAPARPASTMQTNPSPQAGDKAYLHVPDETTVWVAPTKQHHEEMLRRSRAKDTLGIAQMITSGQILVVEAKTKVLVIDHGLFLAEVRMLEGKHAGKSGFVDAEWTHRFNP